MIARLRGEVLENHGTTLVVDCGGVGYEVAVPSSVAFQFQVGERADIFVRHIIREDGQFLFGFLQNSQRVVFDLLRDVKGCGPKTSLNILSELGDTGTISAIISQDVSSLVKVSGIGPRLAERIIVELKDKMPEAELGMKVAAVSMQGRSQVKSDELVDALMMLGFKKFEAEEAANIARESADDVEDQLKIALRSLRR